MAEAKQNLQEQFLNHLRQHKIAATVFLMNGVKLQGVITWFDTFSLLLRRDAHVQLVYKHSISTIMSNSSLQLFADDVTENDAA